MPGINHDAEEERFRCDPGITNIVFEFQRDLGSGQDLWFHFYFDRSHRTVWHTYDSGDYYDRNGIYLSQILFDQSDVTFSGWHHCVDVMYNTNLCLPDQYHQHENRRCVTQGMTFCLHMPAYHSIHKTLQSRLDHQAWTDRKAVDNRLQACIDRLG
jgi:hypothetical protein